MGRGYQKAGQRACRHAGCPRLLVHSDGTIAPMPPDLDERPVAPEAVSAAELRRLREAADEFETFLASFPDLYFRIDPEGRIVDYRARAGNEPYLPPDVS